MSPNAPVPPPPPPPGGVPGSVATGGDDARTTSWSPPPAFAPGTAHGVRSGQAHQVTPADGQATIVQPAVPAPTPGGTAFTQRVTPTTGLPTAAQPAVPAPAPAPAPPQRVRYATESTSYAPATYAAAGPQHGYGAPVAPAAAVPAAHAPSGPAPGPHAPSAAARPAYAPAAQPAYHPPVGVDPASGAAAGTPRTADVPAPRSSAARDGARPRGGSGRLSAGWIAFIVVDVLLVVGAVVFAISLLGGGGAEEPADPGAAPSATAPQETESAPTVPTVTESFASETRNISCEMTDVGVTCSIAELATQPAPVDGCDGTVGYRVVLDSSGVSQPCVPTAEQPQAAPGDTEVLAYGKSKTVGGFTCDSERTGVTCRDDATGKGFTVARAGIRSL